MRTFKDRQRHHSCRYYMHLSLRRLFSPGVMFASLHVKELLQTLFVMVVSVLLCLTVPNILFITFIDLMHFAHKAHRDSFIRVPDKKTEFFSLTDCTLFVVVKTFVTTSGYII